MIKILTVPFSKKDETFFEDEVNQFLLNKKIRATKAEFFNYKDNFYWTIFVDYDPFIAEDNKSEKPAIKLNEKDELLLKRLKEWRKITAEKQGVPVYIVATNVEFLQIIEFKPRTKEAIKKIKGFGMKKIDKYGDDILKIVSCFTNEKRSADF
jgi:superfamily II DNA helicase RecQ